MQGEHPFHNYTIRSKYRKPSSARDSSKTGSGSKIARLSNEVLDPEKEDYDEEKEATNFDVEEGGKEINTQKSDALATDVEGMNSKFSRFNKPGKLISGLCDSPNNDSHDQYPLSACQARWLYEPDKKDKLSASHFRKIFHCSCGKLERILDISYVEISIYGESFMLHQVSLFELRFHYYHLSNSCNHMGLCVRINVFLFLILVMISCESQRSHVCVTIYFFYNDHDP